MLVDPFAQKKTALKNFHMLLITTAVNELLSLFPRCNRYNFLFPTTDIFKKDLPNYFFYASEREICRFLFLQ